MLSIVAVINVVAFHFCIKNWLILPLDLKATILDFSEKILMNKETEKQSELTSNDSIVDVTKQQPFVGID